MMLQLGSMSMKKYVEKLGFKNEKLRYFLTRIVGSEDFPALMLIMMMGWFHERNAGYLVGGSLPIAQRMTQRYRQLGGKLSLETTVDKILVEAGKATGVLLTDGTTLPADIVISAADGHSTLYHMLEGKYLSPKFEEAYRQLNFYMIGQWVNPGGGLPPAVQSGKWIIQTICRENHQRFQTLPDKLPETKTLEPA